MLLALPLLAALQTAVPYPVRESPHYEQAREHAGEPDAIYTVQPFSSATPPPTPSKRVFGFLPYWITSDPNAFRWSVLTDVIYFGADVGDYGDIQSSHAWLDASGKSAIVTIAHAHGRRAMLSAIQPGDLTGMLADPVKRGACVRNLVALVVKAKGDGIDIDFEPILTSQSANFVIFMRELGTALKTAIPGATLTMDTYGWEPSYPGYDIKALAPLVDAIFVMGYNYHWSGDDHAGPNSPLTGTTHWDLNITRAFEDPTVGFFKDAPPEKLVLGVAYYGYDWPTESTTTVRSPTRGKGYTRTYSSLIGTVGAGRKWDAESQTPWFGYTSSGARQVWYDDAESLGKKYEYVKAKGMVGVMIWALGYDQGHAELWDALSTSFPPLVATPDAGVPDAGAPDAGAPPPLDHDAGVVEDPDAGTSGALDAGSGNPVTDSGVPTKTGSVNKPAEPSHGCSSAPGAAGGLTLLLAALMLSRARQHEDV